jgi:hypothetical protein
MKNSVFVLPEHLLYFLQVHSNVLRQKLPVELIDDIHAQSIYGDHVFETLLLHLQPTIENLTGKKLIPTYSFFRNYVKDADLFEHTDRPSCEYSTTISLDSSNRDEPWEIYVDKKPFRLKIGQGVVYKGCEQPHYRDKCPLDFSSHVFLHYVDAEGPNKSFAFDLRKSLYLEPNEL